MLAAGVEIIILRYRGLADSMAVVRVAWELRMPLALGVGVLQISGRAVGL